MLRIAAAWAILGAILACGGSDDESPPPPPTVTAPAIPPTPTAPVAPPPPAMAATQPISLSTGFLPDPQTARGQGGGSTQATTLNSDCRGWIPTVPQHTLTLGTAFTNLRILAHSAQDTTLVVRGPDGAYRCADDSEQLNPIVEGAFQPGVYEIFVGAYHTTDRPNYVIGFSEYTATTAAQLGF